MDFIQHLPVWLLALLIFGLRIADQSLGTIRTIAVVQGRILLSVQLGFFEVVVWVVAVSQVITRVTESPLLVLAYAGGFATGNAVGIALEKWLALGACVVRIISPHEGEHIAELLRHEGQVLTTFRGEGRDGPVTLIYLTCPRRRLVDLLAAAHRVNPHLFYAVEPAREWSGDYRLLAHPSGWRGILKKK